MEKEFPLSKFSYAEYFIIVHSPSLVTGMH